MLEITTVQKFDSSGIYRNKTALVVLTAPTQNPDVAVSLSFVSLQRRARASNHGRDASRANERNATAKQHGTPAVFTAWPVMTLSLFFSCFHALDVISTQSWGFFRKSQAPIN